MSQDDFDIAELATYLHITPPQVEKLAARGNVPGRRVQGAWRFSRAEIHHWMEERMGLLEDDELTRVEESLSPDVVDEDQADVDLPLARMLAEESIAIPMSAKTKRSAIEEMVELAHATGLLWDPDRMREAVHAREQLRSTALPNGLAMLHPRRPLFNILGEPILSLGISYQGIPFGGGKGLTHVFFLICSTDDRSHLHTLARLTRLFQIDDFASQLLDAKTPTEAKSLFEQFETTLSED